MGFIYMTEQRLEAEHSNRWEGCLNKAAQRELLICFGGNMMLSCEETFKKRTSSVFSAASLS